MNATQDPEGGARDRRIAPLFGRERELGELDTALADARSGHRELILIAGESGIGKTRLAEVAADRAEALGMLVLWGRCWEAGGAPAFFPWTQLLRGLLRARAAERMPAELAAGARWAAHLLPELRDALPAGEPLPSLESDQARFALFDAVSSLFGDVSVTQPLLLALDDLHAADRASLLLLEFFVRSARGAPIAVMATYQPALAQARPDVKRLLGTIARESVAVELQGVGEEHVARMIEHRSGAQAPARLVSALHETTDGNPFFAGEVIRLLDAEGQLEMWTREGERARFPLPDSVRETIRRRLEPLTPAAADTLATAAVIGREFRFPTVAAATGGEAEELIEALDEAERTGLVVQVPGTLGGFRFTHGLVQQTLYSDLSTMERMRLHRAVGQAIERTSGAVPERLAELAHHFAEAAPGGDAATAFDYARRAGGHAMTITAYEQAADLFELALAASELLEPVPERRAELLLALGEARLLGGDPHAQATLLEAAGAARTADRADLFAGAALRMRAYASVAARVDDVHVNLLEEALERVGPEDSALRARVLARLAVSLYYRADAAERRARLADEAVAMARRLGDPRTIAQVLVNAQYATWGPDTTERDIGWAEELLRLSEELRDGELAVATRHRQVDFLLELDDLAGADIAIDALERLARENADPRARAYVPMQRARRAMIEGRYAEVERLSAEADAVGRRLGDSMISMLAETQVVAMRWIQQRLGDVEEAALRLADGFPELPSLRAILVRLHCEMGRDAAARRELERLARRDFADVPRYNGWLVTMALLAEACAHLGDPARAARIYELLEPFAKRNVLSPFAVFAGPVSRFLGIAATTCGEYDVAAEHFAAARAAAARLGARPTMALACVDEARMLTLRDAAGDRERALELLYEAGELARELEAERVLQRVEEMRAALAGAERKPQERAEPVAPVSASLRREGEVWAFEYDGRAVRVRESKGVRHLATLLGNPGVEIHALELAAGPEAPAAPEDASGAVLDSEAKESYRRRLEELQEEMEEADAFNDPERGARAREEIEFLSRELAAALGLGGRDRKLGSSAERARVNVTRAIRSTLKRIAEHDDVLGRELEATVRTGTFCSYQPDVRRPVTWRIESD